MPVDGEIALRTHDEDAPERAAAYRRRHKHPDEMCGLGNRDGSHEAVGRINTVVTPCGVCSTLCAWPCVLRAAYAAGTSQIAPKHGCAALACSGARGPKPPRHAATQRSMAAQLRARERVLIPRPQRVEQPIARPLEGDALEAAIRAALSRLV